MVKGVFVLLCDAEEVKADTVYEEVVCFKLGWHNALIALVGSVWVGDVCTEVLVEAVDLPSKQSKFDEWSAVNVSVVEAVVP